MWSTSASPLLYKSPLFGVLFSDSPLPRPSPRDVYQISTSYPLQPHAQLTPFQSEDLEKNYVSHNEKASHLPPGTAEISELSNRLENPLAGKSREELEKDAVAFCTKYNLNEHAEDFRRGAFLAGFPHEIDQVDGITEDEVMHVRNEKDHKWKQPFQIYYVAIISSMAAVVQGME